MKTHSFQATIVVDKCGICGRDRLDRSHDWLDFLQPHPLEFVPTTSTSGTGPMTVDMHSNQPLALGGSSLMAAELKQADERIASLTAENALLKLEIDTTTVAEDALQSQLTAMREALKGLVAEVDTWEMCGCDRYETDMRNALNAAEAVLGGEG